MARNDSFMFKKHSYNLNKGLHGDLSTADIRLLIVDNTLTPTAADATPVYATYSANEVSTAGGYPAGGIVLTGLVLSTSDGVLKFDDTGNVELALDVLGFDDAYWGILYNNTATAKDCIGAIDLGGPVSERTGPFTTNWSANGIYTDTVTA